MHQNKAFHLLKISFLLRNFQALLVAKGLKFRQHSTFSKAFQSLEIGDRNMADRQKLHQKLEFQKFHQAQTVTA